MKRLMLIILLSLVVLFSGVVSAYCNDTDNGLDYLTVGATHNDTDYFHDYCLNSTHLREYYCEGGVVMFNDSRGRCWNGSFAFEYTTDLDFMYACLNGLVSSGFKEFCDLDKNGGAEPTDMSLLILYFNGDKSICYDEYFDLDNNSLFEVIKTDLSILNDCLDGLDGNPRCDINNDTVVNSTDKSQLVSRLNNVTTTIPDGDFDIDQNGLIEGELSVSSDYKEINDCLNGSSNNTLCDIDKNGLVDLADKSLLLAKWNGSYLHCAPSVLDLDGNGVIEPMSIFPNDFEELRNCLNGFSNNSKCDIDGNGGFEPTDMSILINAINGIETKYCNQTSIVLCDLNGNGILDPFLGWQSNFSTNDTPVTTINNPSGGGGGGGGGCDYDPNFDWGCEGWGECINGEQSRTCNSVNNCGNTYGRPETTRSCEVEQEETFGEEDQTFGDVVAGALAPITGAVIGTLGTTGTLIATVFVLLILIGLGVVLAHKAGFINVAKIKKKIKK